MAKNSNNDLSPIVKYALSLIVAGIAFSLVAKLTGLGIISVLSTLSYSAAILLFAVNIIKGIFHD